MPAPVVYTFTPRVVPGGAAAELNLKLRDQFAAILSPPVFRARRTGAQTLTENVHQFVQWDTVDEDSHAGWTSPTVVGGGGNTTMSVASAVSATSITVASTVGLTGGNVVRIGTGAATEYRVIGSIAGSVLNLTRFLALTHGIGDAVVEVAAEPSRYIVPVGWGGWWHVDATVSLSAATAGAAGLVLIPSVAVQGASHTGVGNPGWEGTEVFIPDGAAEPKHANGTWRIWADAGQRIQLDLWYSDESLITAVDVTAGRECRIGMVWDGV